VQASPSLQALPFGAAGFEHWPVAGLHVPATWHWSDAAQTTGFAPAQTPAWQVSVCVHASLSLQAVPSAIAGFEHWPVAGLHVPATWHWSDAVQTTGFAPVHTPLSQVSLCVQASPSLQAVPSAATGFEHCPSAGLHVPATWHWSDAVQTTGFAPVHTPLSQVSLCVQASPSLQAVPSAAAGFEHCPFAGLHVPATWHWSLAVQTTGFAPVQTPVWQVSVCVQASASLHAVPSAAAGFEH
jgi:hypothetical protein